MEALLTSAIERLAAWLLTYWLHSTGLLLAVWAVTAALGERRLALQEGLWRLALVGGLVTASLQVAGVASAPVPVAAAARLQGGWEAAAPVAPTRGAIAPAARSDLARSRPPRPAAAPVPEAVAARPQRPPRGLTVAPRLAQPLLLAWLAGALLFAVRLVASRRALGRRLSDRVDVAAGPLRRLFEPLAARLARPARLTAAARLAVPLARGVVRPEVCLPRRVVDELTPAEQSGVLAHEVAHLARRDPLWLPCYRWLEGLLFVQPLNRLAVQRLRLLAEYRCDDWAVRATGQALDFARSLTRVASWGVEEPALLGVPAMAARGTSLGRRVRRLVGRDATPPDEPSTAWLLAGAAPVLLALALVAPGVAPASGEAPPPPPSPDAPGAPLPAPAPPAVKAPGALPPPPGAAPLPPSGAAGPLPPPPAAAPLPPERATAPELPGPPAPPAPAAAPGAPPSAAPPAPLGSGELPPPGLAAAAWIRPAHPGVGWGGNPGSPLDLATGVGAGGAVRGELEGALVVELAALDAAVDGALAEGLAALEAEIAGGGVGAALEGVFAAGLATGLNGALEAELGAAGAGTLAELELAGDLDLEGMVAVAMARAVEALEAARAEDFELALGEEREGRVAEKLRARLARRRVELERELAAEREAMRAAMERVRAELERAAREREERLHRALAEREAALQQMRRELERRFEELEQRLAARREARREALERLRELDAGPD